jgi:hypothetical protein
MQRLRSIRPTGFPLSLGGIAMAATLVLFACGCGSQPTASETHTADNFLARKAKESGGDFSKLSPADQKKAQELTQGHGPEALRGMARQSSAPK